MIIVSVNFIDWNNCTRSVEVTSNMCEALNLCKRDIDLMNKAFAYVERRYTELYDLISIEIVAK